MFRFGKSKSSASTKKAGASDSSFSADLADLGIPSLDVDDVDDHTFAAGETDVDDEDLDDPELLAQLHALTSADGGASKAKPKPKPKPPPVAHEIDIEKLQMLGADEEEYEVELTEEDMNDPVLLGELKAMGYVEEENIDRDDKDSHLLVRKIPTTSTTKVMPEEPPTPREIVSNAPQDGTKMTTSTPPLSIEQLALSTDKEAIKKRIETEKANAITQNRANDKAAAVQSVRAYKKLEIRLSELSKDDGNHAGDPKNESPPSISISTTSNSKSHPVSADTVPLSPAASPLPRLSTPSPASSSRSTENKATSDGEKLYLLRAEEFKRAALHYKRNGNIAQAKEMLSQHKQIMDAHKAQFENQSSASSFPLENFVLPPPPDLNIPPPSPSQSESTPVTVSSPDTSQLSNTPIKPPNSQIRKSLNNNPLASPEGEDGVMASSDFGQSMEVYAKLESQLESQASLCTSIAGHYLKCGDKTNALAFHKHRKNFLADLESIRSYKASGLSVPTYHYAAFTYTIESANLDLSASEMELAIVRAYGLGNKEVLGSDVEAYVVWDAGWPVDTSGATVGGSKGTTKVAARGLDPEFSFTKRIPIERNKAFQRHLERRKMQFEVLHNRGFLRSKVSLGKCQLRLDSLVSKCEVHEISQLTDSNRRSTGGKLELRVRLRTPLVKADVVQKTEQWLVIDHLLSGAASALSVQPSLSNLTIPSTGIKSPASSPSTSTAPATPTKRGAGGTSPTIPVSPVKSVKDSSETPVKAMQTTTPPKKSGAASAAAVPEVGTASEELEAAEEWFNNVDNIPSNLVLQNELSLLAANQTGLSASEAEDRKQQIDMQMNMFVTYVQTGILTIPKYLDNVRLATTQTKQYALLFKKHGRQDLAVRAMARIKMMMQEVEDVERMAAQGGEDDAEG